MTSGDGELQKAVKSTTLHVGTTVHSLYYCVLTYTLSFKYPTIGDSVAG